MPCVNCECPFCEIVGTSIELPPKDIRCVVADFSHRVRFRHDEVMFMQGQPSTSIYALIEGMVKICTHTADGNEQIVGISSPENLLVGLQSVSDSRYAYTAIAACDVEACRINHRALLARVGQRPDLALRLIQAINAQLAHARLLIEVMGHKCAAAKIAAFIVMMTPRSHRGLCRFELPFSRLELAELLGLSEETVCRVMAGLRRAGAVYAPRGRVEIRSWDRLQNIADGLGACERPADTHGSHQAA